jgi:hypothetical protein
MHTLKRKLLLILTSIFALGGAAVFLPVPAMANHETCGTFGSTQAIERCVQNRREEAFRDCYNENPGDNTAVKNCVDGVTTHYRGSTSNDTPTEKNIDNLSGECKKTLFFGIPTWYKYLPKKSTTPCELDIQELGQVLLILLAVVEILTRLGAFLAVGYIIWGGIKFTMSQGEPDGIANARNTIINAVIGLILTVMATALITFIGQRVGG